MKKNGFVAPVVVLTVICLVVSGLLAYVNSITSPIIVQAAAEAEEEAKLEVLPDADSFTTIEDLSNLPDTVDSVHVADNGAGIVVILSGAGYGGTMQIIVGITSDGTVSGTKVLEHSETAGLGARVAGEDFRNQFVGVDSNLDGVSVISGSSISSNCFINLVKDAFTVFDSVQGGGN